MGLDWRRPERSPSPSHPSPEPFLMISDQTISTPVISCRNGGIHALHPRPGINAYQTKVPSPRRIPALALRRAVMVAADRTESGSCGGRRDMTGTDGRRRHHPATKASLLGVSRTWIDSSSCSSSANCKVPLPFLAALISSLQPIPTLCLPCVRVLNFILSLFNWIPFVFWLAKKENLFQVWINKGT
jgi:hypothetical protein